jgi:hypothetical protein
MKMAMCHGSTDAHAASPCARARRRATGEAGGEGESARGCGLRDIYEARALAPVRTCARGRGGSAGRGTGSAPLGPALRSSTLQQLSLRVRHLRRLP